MIILPWPRYLDARFRCYADSAAVADMLLLPRTPFCLRRLLPDDYAMLRLR